MSLRSWFCGHQMVELSPSSSTCRVFFCSRCGKITKLSVPCKHEFTELHRTVVQPRLGMKVWGYEQDILEKFARLARGSTTILYRCNHCSIQITEQLDGVAP